MPQKLKKERQISQANLDASVEHIYYEADMLWHCLQKLSSRDPSEITCTADRNLLIEGVTLHGRCLYDMLYNNLAQKPDDIIAKDFFSDMSVWKKLCPNPSQKLKDMKLRVGKEVAHLTYGRNNKTTDEKNWSYSLIGQEILDTFILFEKNADLFARRA